MINPYFDIVNYQEDNWEEFLDKICLIDIFKPILKAYPSNDTRARIIKYITMCYHSESDAVVMGMEWQKNKQIIFEKVGLSIDYYQDVVLLKKREIVLTINKLLDFLNGENWSNLCMLKDLIIEMRIAANSPILKSTGEVDYEIKKKCADYTIQLFDTVKEVEAKFVQSHPKLKDGYKEFNQAASREKVNNLRPESYI